MADNKIWQKCYNHGTTLSVWEWEHCKTVQLCILSNKMGIICIKKSMKERGVGVHNIGHLETWQRGEGGSAHNCHFTLVGPE